MLFTLTVLKDDYYNLNLIMKMMKRGLYSLCKRSIAGQHHPDTSLQFYSKMVQAVTEAGPAAGVERTRRVVTGLQPTGALHVGNYYGAVQRCVRLQDQGDDLMIFIADLHSLTSHPDPRAVQENTLELTAQLVASGVDPERSVVFAQSAVPRHAELCWVLCCLATSARLAHLPQYRERAATVGAGSGEVPLGLLLYPVLQAADVLLYRATHVPVGVDQAPHLQLAAQLARSFRHRYGPGLLLEPQALLPEDGSERLRSLRDPNKKMSKSDPNPKSRILLTDSDELIRLKIRKAVTDFTPQVTFEPESRPGVANLVRLHCLAGGCTPEEAVEEAAGLTTAQYKGVVADALCGALRPVRERAAALRARPALLRDVLRHGAARARARADQLYESVALRVGLLSPTTQTATALRDAASCRADRG